MNIVKNIVPTDKYNIKCPYSMTASRIVVHNTANDAPARNEISYMISNNQEISFHYAVDDKEVVQGIPRTEMLGTVVTEQTAREIGKGSQ